jgi:amylosucrase
VHRPPFDAKLWAQRTDPRTLPGRIYGPLKRMIEIRKTHAAFAADGKANWLDSGNEHVLVFERIKGGQTILILASFSEHPQAVERRFLPATDPRRPYRDLLTASDVFFETALELPPYGMRWLLVP